MRCTRGAEFKVQSSGFNASKSASHPHLNPLPSRERKGKDERELSSRPVSGERVRVRGAGRMTIKRLILCMRFPLSYLSFLIFVLNLPISPCLYAQSSLQPALIEGAKKEGKLVWYTSMAVDTSKPLLDAFLTDYP